VPAARHAHERSCRLAVDFKALGDGFLVLLREIGFGMGGRKVVTGGEMANYFLGAIWKSRGRERHACVLL